MIVTVTPSPAIDYTVRVPSFDLGAVNRATESSREASGKGVNVSWALHTAGRATRAIFPAGGDSTAFMTAHLTKAGVPHTIVPNASEVRTNISLVIDGQTGTKVNEPGAHLTGEALEGMLDAVGEFAPGAAYVVTCGSLPPGALLDFHARVAERSRAAGTPAIIDTSGPALRASLAARPALIKPNAHELAELAGARLDTLGDVVDAARRAIEAGPASVLVSLGGDGALLVTADRAAHAVARGVPVVNTVGAGDALLAGFVGADGDIEARLKNAVLWASSAVACATTLFGVREEFASRITVSDVAEPGAALSEPGQAALV